MKIEVGKKYTDGSSIVEIKFIDYESCAWGLDQRLRPRFIATSNVYSWQEVSDKPDPGEGWRLLHPNEDLEAGDEFWSQSEQTWIPSLQSQTIQLCGWHYRRRTTPQYVPYTWEDRGKIAGMSWFRLKDSPHIECKVLEFTKSGEYLRINGIDSRQFLKDYEWLDGSPCGKLVGYF
jgi:hypothetical protein